MSLKSKIQALITAANAKTGVSDTTLTDAVQTLVDGYGGGITPTGSITLTEERSYDVTDKATAVVDMSATRANLAEAVTAKGVDTLPTSSFDTIATNIGLISGGGGLPSSITKIDGGSFTPSTDTACTSYNIPHNLGESPKNFYIWSDNSYGGAESHLTLANVGFSVMPYASTVTAYYGMARKLTNGDMSTLSSAAIAATWLNASTFKVNLDNLYYKAGITYKWIAWA